MQFNYIKKIPKTLLIILFLLYSRKTFANTGGKFDWYWLFYENESRNNYQSFTIRPFYLKNIINNDIFEASFMPAIYWKYKTEKKEEWKSLFGLVDSLNYTHNNGINDYDFGLFPLLLYGNSKEKKDKYLHIWPIGGTIKGKLGQDYITTYVFPGLLLFLIFPPSYPLTLTTYAVIIASFIPVYVSYGSREYNAHGILWPLIQWGKSPTRIDKRILPFYAHNYKKDTYNNYSFLMIFNYQKIITGSDEEKTFFAFPFYGRRWNTSSIRGSSTLLWPFFSWGYDIKRGDFELNFPWPLLQIQTCEDPYIKKRIFFPFYGKYNYESNETFFLTPLYFCLKKHTDFFNSEYYINFFIIWYFKRDYKKEHLEYGTSWRYFKIWPLFQYEYNDKGDVSFNMLSLLPFRDSEGYEKLYQPFWTIFEYRKLQSGERRLGLLIRLYYQQWGDGYLRIKIPIIFSFGNNQISNNNLIFFDYFTLFCYNNDKNGRYISLLFSMFSYSNDGDGNYIRLFWIPIRLERNQDQAINKKKRDNRIPTEIKTEKIVNNENPFIFYNSHSNTINNMILYMIRF